MEKWQEQDYFPTRWGREGWGSVHALSALPGLCLIGICRCFIMQKPLKERALLF